MKTKLLSLLGIIALVGVLNSCSNGNEPDTITKQSINNCFALYQNEADGQTSAGATVGYSLTVNYTKQTCELSITGLALPNGKSYPSVVLENMPFKLSEDDLLTVNAAMVQSSISGFASAPVFSNVKLDLRHRVIDDVYAPAYFFQCNVEGYQFTSSMPNIFMVGRTVSTGPDGTPFTTDETGYQITMASSLNMATIKLSGAHFIQAMPALDIEFPNVPASFDGSNLILKAEALTPTLSGTPNPGFPISNLSATINIAGLSTISFDCAPRTMEGVFHVVATIDPTGVASSK